MMHNVENNLRMSRQVILSEMLQTTSKTMKVQAVAIARLIKFDHKTGLRVFKNYLWN